MTTVSVDLIGWSDHDAVATCDGVRVRIRRKTDCVQWICDEHGRGVDNPQHCPHTQALAEQPADPARKTGTRARAATPTTEETST
jgi:hypothetical protein